MVAPFLVHANPEAFCVVAVKVTFCPAHMVSPIGSVDTNAAGTTVTLTVSDTAVPQVPPKVYCTKYNPESANVEDAIVVS